jgi:hypothetical protein
MKVSSRSLIRFNRSSREVDQLTAVVVCVFVSDHFKKTGICWFNHGQAASSATGRSGDTRSVMQGLCNTVLTLTFELGEFRVFRQRIHSFKDGWIPV